MRRRSFIGAAAAVLALPALPPVAQAFTSEAWGGDLNAAIEALPDGGTIEGGEWWTTRAIDFTGKRGITLRGVHVTFRMS